MPPWRTCASNSLRFPEQRLRSTHGGLRAPFFLFNMKDIKAGLRITRTSSTTGPDRISLPVHDDASGVCLCDLELSLEEFAYAVTGLSLMEVSGRSGARDPRLGVKTKHEKRTILCPESPSGNDRDFYTRWLKQNVVLAPGEESSFYLGSRNSLSKVEGGVLLRYDVRSWPTS